MAGMNRTGSTASTYDFLMKMIIIGESGTGKSCLSHHFIHGSEKENATQTIGVEFASRLVQCAQQTIKLQIWDTAGQERFRSVTKSYYRGASACLLVFDITRRASFEPLDQWLQDARQLCSPELVVAVVGNKLDQASLRQVSSEEARTWARNNGAAYFETSSTLGRNVEQPFEHVCNAILGEVKAGRIDPQLPSSGIAYGDRGLRSVVGSTTTSKRPGATGSRFTLSESNSAIALQSGSFKERCCS